MLNIPHIWSLLDKTSNRIRIQKEFPLRNVKCVLSHVSVTVTLEACIAPIGLDHNHGESEKL